MAKQKEEKTNVMRLLDQKKVPYTPHAYPHGDGEAPDGVTVARSLGLDPDRVFKTLVTRGGLRGILCLRHPRGGHPGPEEGGQGGGGEVRGHAAQ